MKTSLLSLFFCWSCCTSLLAQPLITLSEESTSGKYQGNLPERGPAIVDINSIIRIQVNVAQLEEEMFKFQGIKATDSRLGRLRKLNELTALKNKIIRFINTKFANSNQQPLAVYQELAALSTELLEAIELDEAMFEELTSVALEEAFSQSQDSYIIFVIRYLENKAQEIRNALLADLGVDGQVDSSLMIYFRIGAFLKNRSGGRPVHVENFDTYAPEAYIEVSRFANPLSEDEKSALSLNKRLHDSLQVSTNTLSEHMKSVFSTKFNTLFPKSDDSRLNLRKTFTNSLTKLNSDSNTKPAASILLDNELNIERVGRTYQLIKNSFDQFQSIFPNGLFKENTLNSTLNELESLLNFAYKKFVEDVTLYQQNPNIRAFTGNIPGLVELQRVDTAYNNYVTNTSEVLNGIRTVLGEVERFITPFKKAYVENEELTEAIRRFTVGEIPESGFIELKYIGERRIGDEILIKAVLERGKSRANRNFEQKEIFRRYVSISRIAAHFRMSGSLVLANPYNRESNSAITLENQFQFAPTYGVMMKWGTRKSKFYNDVISLGIGLSFSSPDFNLDGTPEFGTGIMMTAFEIF
ncbi:MAG: hypothetical protein HC912_10095 [Saprospiraceae bacterium]|nr:hypothetical protein [Saprospiraceae bacterium]